MVIVSNPNATLLCLFYQGMAIWKLEYADAYCAPHTNNGNEWHNESSKAECQTLCEYHPDCVGVSYTYHATYSHVCYVCLDDSLGFSIQADPGFNFYRKPGKNVATPSHKCKTETK